MKPEIPPPLIYKSPIMNEMLKAVTPSNIDGLVAEMERMRTTETDFVRRLSIEINLTALLSRRQQYVECGVLETK